MTDPGTALAARLRLAREQAGLSQGQVAKLMRMHRPTVSEIEAGRRRVQVEEIAEFAKLYHVAIPWLLGEEDGGEDIHEAKVRLVARELTKLKTEDLDRVMNLLASLRQGAAVPKGKKR
jgi:transcriptional regulator with XRE-family HTH domain